MLTKNQARTGTTGAMPRRGLRWPMTTVCAVLLGVGVWWLPAHGQSGSSPATGAAALEKGVCETEGALALTCAPPRRLPSHRRVTVPRRNSNESPAGADRNVHNRLAARAMSDADGAIRTTIWVRYECGSLSPRAIS